MHSLCTSILLPMTSTYCKGPYPTLTTTIQLAPYPRAARTLGGEYRRLVRETFQIETAKSAVRACQLLIHIPPVLAADRVVGQSKERTQIEPLRHADREHDVQLPDPIGRFRGSVAASSRPRCSQSDTSVVSWTRFGPSASSTRECIGRV